MSRVSGIALADFYRHEEEDREVEIENNLRELCAGEACTLCSLWVEKTTKPAGKQACKKEKSNNNDDPHHHQSCLDMKCGPPKYV